MNAPAKITAADVAPSDLHLRLLASAVVNGDLSQVPLNFYSKLDWIDCAQWFADVQDEPEDAAQALDELRLMFARSDYFDRWQRLSEREQDRWVDFGNFWSGHRSTWEAGL